MRAALVFLLVILGGCGGEPRSQSYFEANPGERAKVIAKCIERSRRDGECPNAQKAEAAAKAKARQDFFREGF